MQVLKTTSSKQSKPATLAGGQTKLNFAAAQYFPGMQAQQQPGEIMFYGFNSRMIPESVETCKPVFRKLVPRSQEELDFIEKIQAKKRKSTAATKKGAKSKDTLTDGEEPQPGTLEAELAG